MVSHPETGSDSPIGSDRDRGRDMKGRLTSAPVLALPNGRDGFVVYSDASRQGLGCVLMQNDRVID